MSFHHAAYSSYSYCIFMSFSSNIISANSHFIIEPVHKMVISSSSLFIKWSFHQTPYSLNGHFILGPFYQRVISSYGIFTKWSFHLMALSSVIPSSYGIFISHFILQHFHQSFHHTAYSENFHFIKPLIH